MSLSLRLRRVIVIVIGDGYTRFLMLVGLARSHLAHTHTRARAPLFAFKCFVGGQGNLSFVCPVGLCEPIRKSLIGT